MGLVDTTTGIWYLRDPSTGAIRTFYYGNPGDYPIVGDWDCDGEDTPGLYRSDGFIYLRNSNAQGVADIRFLFGNPGDVPVPGDFDGDGCDSVALYRPDDGKFYVMNRLGADGLGLGVAEFSFDWPYIPVSLASFFQPVAGDWDGDGVDGVGSYDQRWDSLAYKNQLAEGSLDGVVTFGDPNDLFVVGDWGIVDSIDSIGVFRPVEGAFYLKYQIPRSGGLNTHAGDADEQFVFPGSQETFWPIAGRWTRP